MTSFTGPSLDQYMIVMGFLFVLFLGFYFLKKNRHLITNKLHDKKRMKVSEVTLLGQGDRALILSLDDKDFLFISGKNSGALLTEIKKKSEKEFLKNKSTVANHSTGNTTLKNFEIKNMIEKRIKNDQN